MLAVTRHKFGKASYVALVYTMPVWLVAMIWVVPTEAFGQVYLPFGITMAILAYMRPSSELVQWVILTPIIFWFLGSALIAIALMFTPGLGQAGAVILIASFVVMSVATLLFGALCVLLAMIMYISFKSLNWLQ